MSSKVVVIDCPHLSVYCMSMLVALTTEPMLHNWYCYVTYVIFQCAEILNIYKNKEVTDR